MASKQRTLGLKLRAVDRMSSAIDRVQKKFPKLTRNVKRASRAAQIFNDQTKQMRRSLRRLGGNLKSFGRTATIGMTIPILAAGAVGVKAFGDFEQGLKGVEKTTGIAGPALARLGARFDKLSTEIPVSTAEMLELAQAGGQLGIKGVDNLEKFTLTLAKLSRASDVAGEDGAKSIARILTVTGTGIEKVDRFSAALVDLGNNAAASESEILEVANRVAGNIGRFDVGADKILGISTALKALGKNSEVSGSVMGRSFDAIDQSIRAGGESLQFISKLTGISSDKIKKSFEEDATAVFQKFVIGLNKVQTGGGNVIKVMNAMGLSGVRINDVLGTLAKNPQILAENLDRSTRAFRENMALQKEFEVQTDSFNSAMTRIGNTFMSFLRLVGRDLAPVVKFVGELFEKMFSFLREHPVLRKVVVIFGAFLAVLGPITFALGAFLALLPSILAGLTALGVTSLAATFPFVLMAAGITALIALFTVIMVKWDALIKFFDQNPFLSIIKSAFFLLTPLGQIISAVRLITSAFESLDAVKNTLRDILPKFVADRIFKGKTLGPAKGAREANRGVAARQQTQEVNGQIGVNFVNAPQGTTARGQFEGPLDFNLGFAGGVQ